MMQVFFRVTLFFLSIQFLGNTSEVAVPKDLLYKGKPLPDFYFFWFADRPQVFNLKDELEEVGPWQDRIEFKWEYLGSYHGKYHLISTYYWEDGCMGKFTQLLLVKREKDQLVVSDVIYGGDRHASSIFGARVDGDKIVYVQGVTSRGLVAFATELFPEIEPLYKRSSKAGLCYGEACFCGTNKFVADVTPEGKFQNRKFLYYRTPEGESPPDKKFYKDEFKEVALEMLYHIDRDKPEELKKDGIAFSTHCFRKILEEDLKNTDRNPCSFNLTSDAGVSDDWYFEWDYIGKTNKYFLIQASLSDYPDDFFGIYTIQRDGTVLKKVGRIFHQKGGRYSTPSSFKMEGEALSYWQPVSARALFQLFCDKFPELRVKAKRKMWSDLDEDLGCGLLKMKVQVLDDGTLKDRACIGFMSSGDPLREERELFAKKKRLFQWIKRCCLPESRCPILMNLIARSMKSS